MHPVTPPHAHDLADRVDHAQPSLEIPHHAACQLLLEERIALQDDLACRHDKQPEIHQKCNHLVRTVELAVEQRQCLRRRVDVVRVFAGNDRRPPRHVRSCSRPRRPGRLRDQVTAGQTCCANSRRCALRPARSGPTGHPPGVRHRHQMYPLGWLSGLNLLEIHGNAAADRQDLELPAQTRSGQKQSQSERQGLQGQCQGNPAGWHTVGLAQVCDRRTSRIQVCLNPRRKPAGAPRRYRRTRGPSRRAGRHTCHPGRETDHGAGNAQQRLGELPA
jgi:hypothetical protein